ncbi:MAG: hypothetical protein NWE76_01220, partial [Candidatus Bathyarchaeota archaeon]|nr:hypothetical protein [Candidatus Bathyarchaeota archaeon]
PFCTGYFCADHRLPENHSCPELWKARTRGPPPQEKHQPLIAEEEPRPLGRGPPIRYPLKYRKPGWTSPTETRDLVVGALLVMAVGLSWYRPVTMWASSFLNEPELFLSSALVFILVFVTHELAHKGVAKHYGLWAEFRLNRIGAILTLLSVGLPLVKIVSPGAVMMAGAVNKKIMGVTALAGPFTSIVLTALFFVLQFLFPEWSFAPVISSGAILGAWIAVLNLIPFGVMDGAKVFWWDKSVWAVSFSASIALLAAVWIYLPF